MIAQSFRRLLFLHRLSLSHPLGVYLSLEAIGYRCCIGIVFLCCIGGPGLAQAQPSEPGRAVDSREPDEGWCSYISPYLDGNRTASGEEYDETELTAAHREYAFGTRLRVTNLSNGEQVVVRINDRGPYRSGRILDVSLQAAQELDFVAEGVTRVRIEAIEKD